MVRTVNLPSVPNNMWIITSYLTVTIDSRLGHIVIFSASLKLSTTVENEERFMRARLPLLLPLLLLFYGFPNKREWHFGFSLSHSSFFFACIYLALSSRYCLAFRRRYVVILNDGN